MIFRWIFGVVVACLWATTTHAQVADCHRPYLDGVLPQIVKNDYLDPLPKQICFEEFAVVHWGKTATPLWVAQRLTKENVFAAKKVDRVDEFHADPRLSVDERAELVHYRGSGYDRGHLAPAADMATETAQRGSFSLANMIPQDPTLNRGIWASFEASARDLAVEFGEVYVITGVTFDFSQPKAVGGRVWIPEAVYKAIYVPSAKRGSAYWAQNVSPGNSYEVISLKELEARTGIVPFQMISDDAKSALMKLPEPTVRSSASAKATVREDDSWFRIGWLIMEFVMRVLR